MTASKPQSTLSRSWAASLEQMNKGETGESNGEKQQARKKKFKTADEYFKGSKIPELEDQECSERDWCSADQVTLPPLARDN
jgi:hypothetical protein